MRPVNTHSGDGWHELAICSLVLRPHSHRKRTDNGMDRITARSDVGLSHLSTTGIFERVAGHQRSWSRLPLTLTGAQVPMVSVAFGELPETKAVNRT